MNRTAPLYVFDTSAWFTLIEDENGSDIVQNILEEARRGKTEVLVSFMSFMAAQLKTEYRLSVADCWIAALTMERKAVLVHKDPEFEQIEAKLQVLKLPYKSSL